MGTWIHLPGAPAKKKAIYRDPDERVASDDIPDAEVQRLILAKLDEKPHHKWELREALGINDTRLLRQLTKMRKQGRVVAFGNRSMERKWKRVEGRP